MKTILNIALIILGLGLAFGLIPWLLMVSWNYLAVGFFDLPKLNFLASLAIVFVAGVIFKK